jgi:short-subunit dehydrogenase
MCALPDALLDKSFAEVAAAYPQLSFRKVGSVLGKGEYLEAIAEATKDLPISLVFNNAGYPVTGFFEDVEWSRHDANISCNVTSAIALSHLFVRRMRAAGLKGAITFTSSPAGFMPSPFSCLYGATKSMMTHFACSLAGEVVADGIDVCVLHPSPVATNFYANVHAMPTLLFFKATASGPDRVAETLLRGIGRSVIVDQGYYSIALRWLLRLVEPALFFEFVARAAPYVADYKVLVAARAAKAAGKAQPTPAKAIAAGPAPPSSSKQRRGSVAK